MSSIFKAGRIVEIGKGEVTVALREPDERVLLTQQETPDFHLLTGARVGQLVDLRVGHTPAQGGGIDVQGIRAVT